MLLDISVFESRHRISHIFRHRNGRLPIRTARKIRLFPPLLSQCLSWPCISFGILRCVTIGTTSATVGCSLRYRCAFHHTCCTASLRTLDFSWAVRDKCREPERAKAPSCCCAFSSVKDFISSPKRKRGYKTTCWGVPREGAKMCSIYYAQIACRLCDETVGGEYSALNGERWDRTREWIKRVYRAAVGGRSSTFGHTKRTCAVSHLQLQS